jgi:hypothetical protein
MGAGAKRNRGAGSTMESEMAHTFSSRGRLAESLLGAALLLTVLALGLAGCGNDHPAGNGGTIRVDLRALQSQVGGGFATETAGPGDSPATTAVKSLVIGAVVITFTDTPLSSDTNINSDLQDKLASDIINSVNYFSIVDLPTSEDFVEFKVPPPGAGHWQVAAVGTRTQILTFNDLNDNSAAIYYGFDEAFHTTSGSSGPDVSLEMKRACFLDSPPNGCAAYGTDGNITITPTVTILDVLDNGTRIPSVTFPINVTSSNKDSVTSTLNAFNPPTGHTITVATTHPGAPGFDSAKCGSAYVNASSLTNASVKDCFGTFVSKY